MKQQKRHTPIHKKEEDDENIGCGQETSGHRDNEECSEFCNAKGSSVGITVSRYSSFVGLWHEFRAVQESYTEKAGRSTACSCESFLWNTQFTISSDASH
jgi:hypothetical protein